MAREKERERSAGRDALRWCGFVAEEQRHVLQRLCRCVSIEREVAYSNGFVDALRNALFKCFFSYQVPGIPSFVRAPSSLSLLYLSVVVILLAFNAPPRSAPSLLWRAI